MMSLHIHLGLFINKDVRFKELNSYFQNFPKKYHDSVNLTEFRKIFEFQGGNLLKRAFQGRLIIPDFNVFREKVNKIFKIVETIDEGHNADYIPQLGKHILFTFYYYFYSHLSKIR